MGIRLAGHFPSCRCAAAISWGFPPRRDLSATAWDKSGEKILATPPEIISVLDAATGEAITSDSLRYGLRVTLISLPAPEIWTTPKGLALVGPGRFGL